MKNYHRKHQSRGMAMGLALIVIMVIGVMAAMFLQRNKQDRDQVQMDSGRKVLLSQANATYDFLMDATIAVMKEYTNKCTNHFGAQVTLNVKNSLGQSTTIQTECPAQGATLLIHSGIWDKIRALVVGADTMTRLKCLRACNTFADFPKMIVTSVEQRDEVSKSLYARVSGRFEVVQGSVSEFSVGAFAVDPTKNVKFVNGIHGDVAVFFQNVSNPPQPPANPCEGGSQGNPVTYPRSVYLMPPQGTELVMDSISLNVDANALCLGHFEQHMWGSNWAQSLTNLGTVTIKKGAILTSSFFSEYKAQLIQKWSQGMNSTYWPAFNNWASQNQPPPQGQYVPMQGLFTSVQTPGLLAALLPSAPPTANITQPAVSTIGEDGGTGGMQMPNVQSADLYLGCTAPDACTARLVENFSSSFGGQSSWTVFDDQITPNKALFTQAGVVNIRKLPGTSEPYATIGANNLYLFTAGTIRLKTSIKQHPGLAAVISDDPAVQGHLGLISISNNIKVGSDFETLDGNETLGNVYSGQTNPTTPKLQVDAGLISAAEGKAPFELTDGLLTPPSSGTKTLGTASFKGPIWGAFQTDFRKLNDQLSGVITGFSNVSTEYPPSWRADPRLAITVSSLPIARDLGRTYEFIDYKAALAAARSDLGLQ